MYLMIQLEKRAGNLHELPGTQRKKKEKNYILNFFRIWLGIFTELFELYVKKSDSLEIRC